jgi:AcrR family transcriptional regulator
VAKVVARRRPVARSARPTARTGGSAPKPRPRVDYAQRKAQYLQAAATVFLEVGPGASMQDVADAAGAPKPVFYRIFPSRAALIDAFFEHVHDVLVETQKLEWGGYGWALKVLYLEARKTPSIFLVALKTFGADPAYAHWRHKLERLIQEKAIGFFIPGPGAPPGAEERAKRATRTLSNLSFDTLVAWLEDRDQLDDESRFRWWGRIIREWRKATREAFQLDGPATR